MDHLTKCIMQIQDWMANNRLKLNEDDIDHLAGYASVTQQKVTTQ